MCVIMLALWLTIHPKCVFKLRKEALYFMHEITTITAINIQNMKWFICTLRYQKITGAWPNILWDFLWTPLKIQHQIYLHEYLHDIIFDISPLKNQRNSSSLVFKLNQIWNWVYIILPRPKTFVYQMHYGNRWTTSHSFALEIVWIDGALDFTIE